MLQSWYLSCEMQLFILLPIIIWLINKNKVVGIWALLILIIFSIIVVFTIIYINREDGILIVTRKVLRDTITSSNYQKVYSLTHMRATPYFIGILAGYIKYYIQRKKYIMSKLTVYIGWSLAVLIFFATLYSAHIFYIPEQKYNPLLAAAYGIISHISISGCISFLILTVSEGHLGNIRVQLILCLRNHHVIFDFHIESKKNYF